MCDSVEMHHITSWPCVSVQTRPTALFGFLSTQLSVILRPTQQVYKCAILFSFCCHYMLCEQLVGDNTVLKEKVAHCHLKKLELHGRSNLLPLLSCVKDNRSVLDFHVTGKPITTCIQVTIR